MSLYENYASIRDAKGMTNYRVAKEAGISQAILSNWKTNNSTPDVHTLIKVAKALQVNPSELLDNVEIEEKEE